MKLFNPRVTMAALALLVSAAPALAQTKIMAGVAATNEALAPIYAAKAKGYLDEAGVEIEMVNFKGGGATVKALIGGSVDLCLCAADHVLRLGSRGMPAKILVGMDEHHSYALIAKSDSPYGSLEDLKGKKLAITSPGSLTDNTLRYMIGEKGLSPDTDYQIIATGGGAPMRAALATGQVDAGMLITTDVLDILTGSSDYKVVEDFRELAYPSFTLFALQSWIDENPELAAALTEAVVKAVDDLKADPEFAKEVISTMYPNFSDELATAVAASMVSRMPTHGKISAESFTNLNNIITTMDPDVKALPLEKAVDASMIAD